MCHGLKIAFDAEEIEDIICGNCEDLVRIIRRKKILEFPDILMVHCRRYAEDGSKINDPLICDEGLNTQELYLSKEACIYTFRGSMKVVCPSVFSGHYTAVIAHYKMMLEYSDDKVFIVSFKLSLITNQIQGCKIMN